MVEISPGNYADSAHQQCYLSNTPHIVQASKGYMEDYPELFYTSPSSSAELRDVNEGSINDVSAFLKDFMKKQEIEGLYLLWLDSPKEELQWLIEIAHTDFPNTKFLRVITDKLEGVEGQKDYTRLLSDLHTQKVLSQKLVIQAPEDKVE